MLSDKDIRDQIQQQEVEITPFDEDSLTPVGYDLRVGRKAFSWKILQDVEVNARNSLKIEPGDTVVIETYELIQLSKKISGTLHAMATHTLRRGLSHISTTVDPGWTGKLLVSVHNHLNTCIELDFEEKFCTICLYRVESEAQKDVGRQSGRSDIWAELIDKARSERARLSANKELEKKRQLAQVTKRKFYLVSVFLAIVVSGLIGYYFLEPAGGALLMSGITAAVVLLPDIFKSE